MVHPCQNIIALGTLMLLSSVLVKNVSCSVCPNGFQVGYIFGKDKQICYRLKGPEKYSDTYRDCAGNLYTTSLFHALNIKTEYKLWTEYKTAYPNGPFVDWSYTANREKLLDTGDYYLQCPKVRHYYDLCVVLDTRGKYLAVKCNGTTKYHRYCIVKPDYSHELMSSKGCAGFKDSRRILSPRPTCLFVPYRRKVWTSRRVTWSQLGKKCSDNVGMLLNRGWIYLTKSELIPNVKFTSTQIGNTSYFEFPVGVSKGLARVIVIPYNTDKGDAGLDHTLVRVNTVDKNYTFYDTNVICEKPVHLKVVDLRLEAYKGAITLRTNVTIDKKYISCFSDSETFYPTPMDVTRDNDTTFILKPLHDGHYWCITTDSINHIPSESNKIPFFRENKCSSLRYEAAITLDINKYNVNNVEKSDSWRSMLQEYIYCYTMYTKDKGVINWNPNFGEKETILKKVKAKNALVNVKRVIRDVKLRKVYRNMTIVVHLELNHKMRPAPAGFWEDMEVHYMKPLHPCNTAFNTTSSAKYPDTVEVRRAVAERKLEKVTRELETLVDNAKPVPINKVRNIFAQVNDLLETDVDVEIKGNLLPLLDAVGIKMDLKGTAHKAVVRSNIALVVADTKPDQIVRGLKIKRRDTKEFSENTFEILSNVDSNHENRNHSEVAVELPMSVSMARRRITFVAFRNGRAFQNNPHPVNSLLVSINVENLTQFDANEVIDIHFTPHNDAPKRNESRVCAYWHFVQNGSGYWSQDGCSFIRATEAGSLDICRSHPFRRDSDPESCLL